VLHCGSSTYILTYLLTELLTYLLMYAPPLINCFVFAVWHIDSEMTKAYYIFDWTFYLIHYSPPVPSGVKGIFVLLTETPAPSDLFLVCYTNALTYLLTYLLLYVACTDRMASLASQIVVGGAGQSSRP